MSNEDRSGSDDWMKAGILTTTIQGLPERSTGWIWLLVASVAAALAFEVLPEGSVVQTAILPGTAAAAAALMARFLRVRRPVDAAAWWILTAGTAIYALAATVWSPNVAGLLALGPPSIGDWGFVASYLVTLTGVGLLLRSRGRGQGRGSMLDALIVATGAGVLVWIVLVDPYLDSTRSLAEHAASLLYPFVDVLLLGMAARLFLMPGGRKNATAILLGIYIVCQLVADTMYGTAVLGGRSFTLASPAFLLWICSMGTLGAAALHPSAARLAEPIRHGESAPGRWRLGILALAAVSVPVAEVVQGSSLETIDRVVFGSITVALFLLILLRTRGLAVSVEEHRRVLARLRSTETLYRSLVETNPAVTYVDVLEPGSDAGYRTRYMSPQIEEWVGYAPQAFLDDPALWLALVHPADHKEVEAAHEHHYATAESFVHEYRLLGRDGRVVWIRDHAEILQGEDGRPVSQGVAHDITERHLAEEAERARQRAEEANRASGQLLSRVSHELRTPLNAILGFGQLLQTSNLSQDDRESADRVVSAGHHLLGLVDEILEISHGPATEISAGEPIDVGEMLLGAVALVEPGARARGVAVLAPDPRPFLALADPDPLRRALCRLLDHVVLDEPEGGRVTATSLLEDDLVRIRIAGSSPGIPEDERATVFSPFNLRSADPGGAHAGAGTDLASAKHLIEAMGGTVVALGGENAAGTFEIGLRVPAG
jgi:PAS domain S-box-containing protein